MRKESGSLARPTLAKGPWEGHPVNLHRFSNSRETLWAKLPELEGYLVSNLDVNPVGKADAARVGEGLNPRGDVDRAPEDVGPDSLDISHLNANPDSKRPGAFANVAFVDGALEVDPALDRVEGVGELDEEAVSRGPELAAVMGREDRPDQSLLLLQQLQRPRFVGLGKRDKSGDVGEHYGGESARPGRAPPSPPGRVALGPFPRCRRRAGLIPHDRQPVSTLRSYGGRWSSSKCPRPLKGLRC